MALGDMRDLMIHGAFQEVLKENPRLRSVPFNLRTQDSGNRYAEAYQQGERDSPTPEFPTISIFDKSSNYPAIKKLLLGETLDIQSEADPSMKKIKTNLRASLTPKQLTALKGYYSTQPKEFTQGVDFEKFLNNQALTALIRGNVSPMNQTEQQEFSSFATPEQLQTLNSLKALLQQPK